VRRRKQERKRFEESGKERVKIDGKGSEKDMI
jgi:hypothetical protein